MLTGTKEIKKVAEARMRKKKRAANTLKAAKKSATMMAENSEMSEKQKLKVRHVAASAIPLLFSSLILHLSCICCLSLLLELHLLPWLCCCPPSLTSRLLHSRLLRRR